MYKGRIKAACRELPVSENDHLPPSFGLRHRAAVGMSELTDTLILAISEESGRLTLARNGKYLKGLKLKQTERKILEYLHRNEPGNWEEVPQEEETLLQLRWSKPSAAPSGMLSLGFNDPYYADIFPSALLYFTLFFNPIASSVAGNGRAARS